MWRMINHLSGVSVVVYLAPADGTLPEPDGDLDYAWEEDDTWVFGEQMAKPGGDGDFLFSSGLHDEPLRVPAWRLAQIHFDGGRLVCTSWMYGIDPRSRYERDGEAFDHADPEGRIPIAICPIHQL